MITRTGTGTLQVTGGKQQFVDFTLLNGLTVASGAAWSFDGASQVIIGNTPTPPHRHAAPPTRSMC